jgi:hypothetical protein
MRASRFVFAFGLFLFLGLTVNAQSTTSICDPSLGLSEMKNMPPKGRFQDTGSLQAKRIIELNKKAIPLLIACLTDESYTENPVKDDWPATTFGAIAFFFLCDLFTDSKQHTTIDGVVNWQTLKVEFPNETAYKSWSSYLKKHGGRDQLQSVWSKRWEQIKGDVVWDQKEKCFKVGAKAARSASQN